MVQIIKGHIIDAPEPGQLRCTENGYLVAEDGVIRGIYQKLPEKYRNAPVEDMGDGLVMQSFADMHLHAPQYPMLGMGMDVPLLDWLEKYAFPTEARFADGEYARRVYRKLARKLADNGTTRVCAFSSMHAEATLILMEELEKAGIWGYVGKVNMDRNCLAGVCQEETEESKRETLRWLDGAKFAHVKPMLTPRFTPACSDEIMAFLGRLAGERGLPVQSHLSENGREIAFVRELTGTEEYWQSYERFGLWREGTLMAHCVHSSAAERAAMRRSGVWAVHCPDSNINITSGICPVRTLLREGNRVALGSDIAGGDELPMYRAVTAAIRSSKVRRIMDGEKMDFLTVEEGYYLGSGAGHSYFDGKAGFQPGQPLHAIAVDDGDFPEPVRELTVQERFERAIYLMEERNIVGVWAGQRRIKG